MKNFNRFVALTLCILFGASCMLAANDAEKIACREMASYIKNDLKLHTEIGSDDNSVNFYVEREGDAKKRVYYWLTFDGNATQMLFTLHRRGILNYTKAEDKNNKFLLSLRKQYALVAADYITRSSEYKAYVKDDQMEFEFPVYASSASEYKKVFSKVLRSFGDVKATYDGCMKNAMTYVNSCNKFWAENDTAKVILPQYNVVVNQNDGKTLTYNTMAVRNVNVGGQEISGYDKPLRKSEARFIQPKVTITPSQKGAFTIEVKIFDPKGKLLVPNRDADYTVVGTGEASKAGKAMEFELPTFGTSDAEKGFWKSTGDYRIEFYQNGYKLGESTFNFL